MPMKADYVLSGAGAGAVVGNEAEANRSRSSGS